MSFGTAGKSACNVPGVFAIQAVSGRVVMVWADTRFKAAHFHLLKRPDPADTVYESYPEKEVLTCVRTKGV